jgi:hypothetical protein
MEPIALTIGQAARVLQVSRATAYQRGALPVAELGPRCKRVPVDSLRRWLDAAAQGAPPPPLA